MAILVATRNSRALLAAIRKSIDEKHVATWSYDQSGDFTHDVDQWRYHAWLRPTAEMNRLVLGIIKNTKINLTDTIYGVYHGRFTEMLLAHHTALFSTATCTAGFLDGYDFY
ncbi:hypothetical protein FFI97_001510 [Variovorax sp. KBS0712]|uniref:hypothetical protein n=1 Tax=Variovorax sp. KBS0712 TaxID=2578111 RepID=UPI00111836A0|nr:hypothetical protein [Variovorax sp. KBS0712]TSD59034.1 hypothetical protein FFI97_001510 [Variovorax sp. KBS0712]